MTGKLKPFINSSNDQKRVEENVSHTTVDMKISIKFKKEKCEIYSITHRIDSCQRKRNHFGAKISMSGYLITFYEVKWTCIKHQFKGEIR